jgi:hypothetical protein
MPHQVSSKRFTVSRRAEESDSEDRLFTHLLASAREAKNETAGGHYEWPLVVWEGGDGTVESVRGVIPAEDNYPHLQTPA